MLPFITRVLYVCWLSTAVRSWLWCHPHTQIYSGTEVFNIMENPWHLQYVQPTMVMQKCLSSLCTANFMLLWAWLSVNLRPGLIIGPTQNTLVTKWDRLLLKEGFYLKKYGTHIPICIIYYGKMYMYAFTFVFHLHCCFVSVLLQVYNLSP